MLDRNGEGLFTDAQTTYSVRHPTRSRRADGDLRAIQAGREARRQVPHVPGAARVSDMALGQSIGFARAVMGKHREACRVATAHSGEAYLEFAFPTRSLVVSCDDSDLPGIHLTAYSVDGYEAEVMDTDDPELALAFTDAMAMRRAG